MAEANRLEPKLPPFLQRLLHRYWRFSRGMTLGVRAAVLDADGRVFLVRHTYVPGWHLPGGGVEAGETALDALRRELAEEARIELAAEPPLYGVYFNAKASRRDHVLLYVVRNFRILGAKTPDREIAEAGFFPVAALGGGDAKLAHHIKKHVIAVGGVPVEVDAVQPRRGRKLDAGFLAQLARERVEARLARLDAAARQMPSGHVGMADQEHSARIVEHGSADSQRHAAGKPPVAVQEPLQKRRQLRLEAALLRHQQARSTEVHDPGTCLPRTNGALR